MLDWLRLIRASGLATIGSNTLAALFMAFYVGDGDRIHWLAMRLYHHRDHAGWVLLASLLLYASGMLWNDLVDVDRDHAGNPRRPLPSGRIGLVPAYVVGTLMLLGAVFSAMQVEFGLMLGGIVLSLAMLYNLGAKEIPWLGSVVMALTRATHACFALLLLGPDMVRMVLSGDGTEGHRGLLVYPLVLGLYVFGVTLVSELEDRDRRGKRLTFLVGGACMGLALLVALQGLLTAEWLRPLLHAGTGWAIGASLAVLFAVLCAVLLGWRVFSAWLLALRTCRCDLVKPTVGAALGGMILLDAIIATTAHPLAGLCIALLYPLFLGVSRMIRMD